MRFNFNLGKTTYDIQKKIKSRMKLSSLITAIIAFSYFIFAIIYYSITNPEFPVYIYSFPAGIVLVSLILVLKEHSKPGIALIVYSILAYIIARSFTLDLPLTIDTMYIYTHTICVMIVISGFVLSKYHSIFISVIGILYILIGSIFFIRDWSYLRNIVLIISQIGIITVVVYYFTGVIMSLLYKAAEETDNTKKAMIELKETENKLNILNNELEKKVEERTYELNARNREFIRELNMAKRVQESIIPAEADLLIKDGIQVSAYYSSMAGVGGDIFDVMKLSEDEYSFYMADVTGHGVPAALIASMAKVTFESYSSKDFTPGEILSHVNKDMYRLIGDVPHYLTAYYIKINISSGELSYSSAGHPPALLYHADDGSVNKLDTKFGTLIGLLDDQVKYETGRLLINKGDRVIMFTDGILEAKNQNDDLYSYKNLIHFIQKNSRLSTKDFIASLVKDIEKFSEKRSPEDDRALLCIEYTGENGKHKKYSITYKQSNN